MLSPALTGLLMVLWNCSGWGVLKAILVPWLCVDDMGDSPLIGYEGGVYRWLPENQNLKQILKTTPGGIFCTGEKGTRVIFPTAWTISLSELTRETCSKEFNMNPGRMIREGWAGDDNPFC